MIHRLFLVLLLVPAACRTESTARALPPPPDPMAALPGDAEVEAALETLDVRTSGNELRFSLRNRTEAPLEFCWSVEWYDRAGGRVPGSARAWQAAKLAAGAALPCRVPMPTPDASSWRLRAVRPGSNTLTQGVSR